MRQRWKTLLFRASCRNMEPSRDMIDLPLTTAELMQANPTYAATRFLCCECGTLTTWNASSMCHNCLKSRVDISEGITTSVMLQKCRACGRYLDAPKMWKNCELESRVRILSVSIPLGIPSPSLQELLSICLKRIKGMNKVKLIGCASHLTTTCGVDGWRADASFIWTEPHSKRLKATLRR